LEKIAAAALLKLFINDNELEHCIEQESFFKPKYYATYDTGAVYDVFITGGILRPPHKHKTPAVVC